MENFFIPFSHLLRKQFEFTRIELEYKWHFKNSERKMAVPWKERILHFLQPFKTEIPDTTPKKQEMG